jgi:hypothetical protein
METRTITQVKIYKLQLNPMMANFEKVNIVAIAYDLQKLMDWYLDLKVLPYQEDRWHKVFKKGSKLEWYNSMEDNSNCGIEEEWTTEEAINQFIAHAQNSWGFIETPELIVN